MLSVALDKAVHLVLSLQSNNTIYFTELQGELTSNFRDLAPHDSEKEVTISIPWGKRRMGLGFLGLKQPEIGKRFKGPYSEGDGDNSILFFRLLI